MGDVHHAGGGRMQAQYLLETENHPSPQDFNLRCLGHSWRVDCVIEQWSGAWSWRGMSAGVLLAAASACCQRPPLL